MPNKPMRRLNRLNQPVRRSLARESVTVVQNNYYQNRSCLRPYLLGYSTKTHLKTSEHCPKRACSGGENCLAAQKKGDLGKKSSQSRLFTGVSSYEMNSFTALPSLKGWP